MQGDMCTYSLSKGGLDNLSLFSGCLVAQLLEQAPLDLFFHVSLNSSKHISEECTGTVPNMTKEE
jgi:hypothetical protein